MAETTEIAIDRISMVPESAGRDGLATRALSSSIASTRAWIAAGPAGSGCTVVVSGFSRSGLERVALRPFRSEDVPAMSLQPQSHVHFEDSLGRTQPSTPSDCRSEPRIGSSQA